ncbi:hypothetical protein [Actinomadura sp. NTSP31]|uniref:hypothetical protein n=1 Tax=Actinomadura sp. NTSP31 TaxID=1735447 RepID=UPI0035BF02FE
MPDNSPRSGRRRVFLTDEQLEKLQLSAEELSLAERDAGHHHHDDEAETEPETEPA